MPTEANPRAILDEESRALWEIMHKSRIATQDDLFAPKKTAVDQAIHRPKVDAHGRTTSLTKELFLASGIGIARCMQEVPSRLHQAASAGSWDGKGGAHGRSQTNRARSTGGGGPFQGRHGMRPSDRVDREPGASGSTRTSMHDTVRHGGRPSDRVDRAVHAPRADAVDRGFGASGSTRTSMHDRATSAPRHHRPVPDVQGNPGVPPPGPKNTRRKRPARVHGGGVDVGGKNP